PTGDVLETDDGPIISDGHAKLLPKYLSCSDRKRRLISADTYFVEAFEDLERAKPPMIETFVLQHAALLIKPDAFAARTVETILSWVTSRRFVPVGVRRVRLTPHVVRAVWRYQWNIATRDRKDIMDVLLP